VTPVAITAHHSTLWWWLSFLCLGFHSWIHDLAFGNMAHRMFKVFSFRHLGILISTQLRCFVWSWFTHTSLALTLKWLLHRLSKLRTFAILHIVFLKPEVIFHIHVECMASMSQNTKLCWCQVAVHGPIWASPLFIHSSCVDSRDPALGFSQGCTMKRPQSFLFCRKCFSLSSILSALDIN
jgi:hypothetical protein